MPITIPKSLLKIAQNDPRFKFKFLTKEMLEILNKKEFITPSGKKIDISKFIDYSIKHTEIIDEMLNVSTEQNLTTAIEVVNEPAQTSAIRLLAEGKTNLVALNFASAINPGGGVLSGANAQEESLARSSGLYSCLLRKPMYYNRNNLLNHSYYNDEMIYSPGVVFFRDGELNLLEEPFFMSIITAAAPAKMIMKEPDLLRINEAFRVRINRILQLSMQKGHKTLILGAWGSGAFGNDAQVVANIFKNCLNNYSCFEHICFSVYDKPENTYNFDSFKKVFG